MPFPFVLPTTSHLAFQQSFTSSTHPSLPATATAERNLVRSALKHHKRLAPTEQSNSLNEVLTAITAYLKYVCTLDRALSGQAVNDEDVDLALTQETTVEWRPSLAASSVPGRAAERVAGRGLDYELFSILHAFAVVQNLLARQVLLQLYVSVPDAEHRVALVQTATRHVKTACVVHGYLSARAAGNDGPPEVPVGAVDVVPAMQTGLQRLAQAEFNLLSAFKDDPYPAVLVQSRNDMDREWMIKAPEIPRTRAQVLTRLCVGAAEHAGATAAIARAEKRVSKDFIDYVDDLRRTARARACRFQAIDADARSETGLAIGWLQAGLNELGVEVKDASHSKGLGKLKASWQERREDKKVSKGSARWGMDGGKMEEIRILEFLEKKMVKSNDSVHFQKVPDFKPLLGTLPSGMNMPLGNEKWTPPLLGEDELIRMRAPPDYEAMEADSSGDEEFSGPNQEAPAGAFPGTDGEYKSYY